MWTGSDVEAQRRIGLTPNEEGAEASQRQIAKLTRVRRNAPIGEVVVKTHEVLATAPSRLVTAQLDDALAVEERPNMPATMGDKWPNWCLALPKPLEEIQTDPLVRSVAGALLRHR
jgi:4-alpha-glucanotransferase